VAAIARGIGRAIFFVACTLPLIPGSFYDEIKVAERELILLPAF
jgi:hypothetical protein